MERQMKPEHRAFVANSNKHFKALEEEMKEQLFDLSDSTIVEGDDARHGQNLADFEDWATLTEEEMNQQHNILSNIAQPLPSSPGPPPPGL